MYKLFTLALFALVLSACGGPPAPLSDSCRTFNPFAADCTGEEADEVQRETCLFNPGFHSSCRGDAGVIADWCRDTNNPRNVFHEYCTEELTTESLAAAHRAACLITPEISDVCSDVLTDFCQDPDDPFHAGCRTTVGIGLKQADACIANPDAHATCMDLLATLCEGSGDPAKRYHTLCDNSFVNIGFARASRCVRGDIPREICEPHRILFCTTIISRTREDMGNFESFCDDIENIDSIRFQECNTHFIIGIPVITLGEECPSFLSVYCVNEDAPERLFYETCGYIVADSEDKRTETCFDMPTLVIPSGEYVDGRGCNHYIGTFCAANPFNTDIDAKCSTRETRDDLREMQLEECGSRGTSSECMVAYSFCEMNLDNSACVDAPVRPNAAAWEASFTAALEDEAAAGNKFLIDARIALQIVNTTAVGKEMYFTDTTHNTVALDINEDSDNRRSGVAFFRQVFDGTIYYYAGIAFDAKLGKPLTTETAKGTWEGGFRAVIGDNTPIAAVDMELEVTFNPNKISAFVPEGNNHFLLDGVFSDFGVISGTVNYGVFTDNDRTTPMGNRGTNGTLTGLIGDYGAVGAFVSGTSSDGGVTITGGTGATGYAGGFVVIRRVPE